MPARLRPSSPPWLPRRNGGRWRVRRRGRRAAVPGGETLSRQLRQRLFAPLGLDDTYCGTDEDYPQAQVARAYMHADAESGQWDVAGAGEPIDGVWDATDWFPLSGAGAAGDMVSTARDLAHWMDCLFNGKVLGRKAFDEMAKERAGELTSESQRLLRYAHPMQPISLETLADLAKARYGLAAHCWRCNRWHNFDIAELVARHGSRWR